MPIICGTSDTIKHQPCDSLGHTELRNRKLFRSQKSAPKKLFPLRVVFLEGMGRLTKSLSMGRPLKKPIIRKFLDDQEAVFD